jgi:ABC-type nitrate/sulfonate/bicarbonate transport system substrate-binding protein
MTSVIANLLAVLFLLSIEQAFFFGASRAASAEEKIRLSVAAVTGSYMDEFVAIEKGYHRDEGLAVEMIRAGGGVATQALIAGDLHFSTSAAPLSAPCYVVPISKSSIRTSTAPVTNCGQANPRSRR